MREKPGYISVPGAEADQTRHVIEVAGRQADAELLVEVENFRARELPGLLSLDDSATFVKGHFHVNI